MKKKLLSLCLVLVLLLALMMPSFAAIDEAPASAEIAIETVDEPTLQTGGIIPSEFPDEIEFVEELPVSAASTYAATDQTDAVKYIRKEMKKHTVTIQFSLPVSSSITNAQAETLFFNCFYSALAHTGVGDEGDYILFNLGGINSAGTEGYSQGRITYYLEPKYLQTIEQEKAVTDKVNRLVSMFGFTSETSDYQKFRTIYDYITHNIVYTKKDLNLDEVHNTYSALVDRDTVCQGYASAFYRLALTCGLQARCVQGTGGSGDQADNHGWNIVRINGKWYYTDPTWDAGRYQAGFGYPFCLKGSNSGEFPDHIDNRFTDGSVVADPPAELNQVSRTSYIHPLEILEQPQDIYVAVGDKDAIWVNAVGTGLQYEWRLKSKDGSSKTIKDYSGISFEFTESNKSHYDGLEAYCILTDSSGNKVTTRTATIHLIDPTAAYFAGWTLSLSGDIGINYYMQLSDAVRNNSNAHMHFTIPGETVKTVDIPASQGIKTTMKVNGQQVTFYVFTAEVAAKDMTQDVHSEFYIGSNKKVMDYYFNVKDYAEYIMQNSSSYGSETSAMVESMLNYGGYAQKNFDYHVDDLANINLVSVNLPSQSPGSNVAYSKSGSVSGVTYKGARLMLRTNTMIWHYVKVDGNISDYTFKVDGQTVTPVKAPKMGENWYRIEVSGVPAKSLDHFYKLTVTEKNTSDTLTVNYCVNSNIKTILDNPSRFATENVNMMKALHVFGNKTKAYFAS